MVDNTLKNATVAAVSMAAPIATNSKPKRSISSIFSSPVYNDFFLKFVSYLAREDIQVKIKSSVVDPLVNHVMRQVFPYIILTSVLFILLLVVVLLTLGMIILQRRNPPGYRYVPMLSTS